MLLRDSKHAAAASYDAAIARARKFRQDDPDGYRAEFIKLAELAASLGRMQTTHRQSAETRQEGEAQPRRPNRSALHAISRARDRCRPGPRR